MINDSINSIKEKTMRIKTLKTEIKETFNAALKQVFIDYPGLSKIEMRVNNHEFNDGDPTYFSLYIDGMEVTVNKNVFKSEFDTKLKKYIRPEPLDSLYNLFAQTQDYHEDMFSDQIDCFTLTRKDILSDNEKR